MGLAVLQHDFPAGSIARTVLVPLVSAGLELRKDSIMEPIVENGRGLLLVEERDAAAEEGAVFGAQQLLLSLEQGMVI